MSDSDSTESETQDEQDSLSINRRKLLATTGGAMTTGLAGCPGGGKNTGRKGTPTPQPDPPLIVDATLPPTAVETDEKVSLDITIDVSPANRPADPNDVVLFGEAALIRRGTVLDPDALSATTNTVKLSQNRLRLEYTFDTPKSAVQFVNTNKPHGLGYRLEMSAVYGTGAKTWDLHEFAGQSEILGPNAIDSSPQGKQLQFQTWAFKNVDSVAVVPAVAADENGAPTGKDLFYKLRRNAEKTCRYYASELGTMGAQGFDMEVVTRTNNVANGWVDVPSDLSVYENAANNHPFDNPERFAQDALDAAANNAGINFSSWDLAAVLSDNDYGRPFYRGDFVSTPIQIELGMIDIEIQTAAVQNMLPVSAYATPTGRTDYWWDQIDGDAWCHELGHSLGPGNKVGMPDLYQMQVGNLGVIHGWGRMGSGGDVFMSWCRQLGGYFFKPRNWLKKADHMHLATDTTVQLTPLTDKEVGDNAAQLTTLWGEFHVKVQYATVAQLIPKSISISPRNVHLRSYVLEARPGGTARLENPGTRNKMRKSPSGDDGIAIYRFGQFNLQGAVDVRRALNGQSPIQVNNLTPIDLQFLDPSTGNQDEPTLSRSKSSQYHTRKDRHSVMTFEQKGTVSSGSPRVVAKRNPSTLIGKQTKAVAQIASSVKQFIENRIGAALPGGPPVELPGIDILAETPEGRRVGTDPGTGEVYSDIEGAEVVETGVRQEIILPADADVSVTVSSVRLRESLAELGVEVPERIPFTQELVLTADPSIDDERSIFLEEEDEQIPYIQGRSRQTQERGIGLEPVETVVTPEVRIDIQPESVPESLRDNFIFVELTFDQAIDPENLLLETVAMGSLQPLDPEQADVVPPAVVREEPEARVLLTFDRVEVFNRLGEGPRAVAISGIFGRTAFYGSGTFEGR